MNAPDAGVAIIGAGPAGLSLAYHLRDSGIQAILLEQGESAGWSWQRMPEDMMLNTPWCASCLPGSGNWGWKAMEFLSRREFAEYLVEYTSYHRLSLAAGCRVESLAHGVGGAVSCCKLEEGRSAPNG